MAITAVCAAVACWASPARAAAPESIDEQAAQLLWWGDLDALQTLYDRVRDSHQRDTRGDRELDLLLNGLGRTFRGRETDSAAYYTQVVELTRQYARAHPASALAHALVARALYGRAWAARGGNFADKVPAPAMAAFVKDIRAAEQYLQDHAEVAMTDPSAHVYLLMIGRSAGWSHDKQWAVVQDALRRDPDHLGIYPEMVASVLPKWGGSPEAIEAVIQDAVQRTRPTLGTAMYAELYMGVVFEYEGGFFRQTGARWESMKRAFDDLLVRFPSPVNVNRYAMVACLAEDRPVATQLLQKIGDAPILTEWARGGRGQKNFDACKQWLREGRDKK